MTYYFIHITYYSTIHSCLVCTLFSESYKMQVKCKLKESMEVVSGRLSCCCWLLSFLTKVVNKINYLCCKYEWRKLDKQKGKSLVQTTLAQSFLPIRSWSRGHILFLLSQPLEMKHSSIEIKYITPSQPLQSFQPFWAALLSSLITAGDCKS